VNILRARCSDTLFVGMDDRVCRLLVDINRIWVSIQRFE